MNGETLSLDTIANINKLFPDQWVSGVRTPGWANFRQACVPDLSTYHVRKALGGEHIKYSVLEVLNQAYDLLLLRIGVSHDKLCTLELLTLDELGERLRAFELGDTLGIYTMLVDAYLLGVKLRSAAQQ